MKVQCEEPIFLLQGGSRLDRFKLFQILEKILERRNLKTCLVRADFPYSSLLGLLGDYDAIILEKSGVALDTISLSAFKDASENEKYWIPAVTREEAALLHECAGWIEQEYVQREKNRPVWGCILIGGKSSRMGRPKHLLPGVDGRSWLERSVGILDPYVENVVVSGGGELPASLVTIPRLADIPGMQGPISGLVSASRWLPRCSWLVVACDMPLLSEEAVEWLLAERASGEWGRLPRLAGRKMGEPLFAWYDCRGIRQFEEMARRGEFRVGKIGTHPKLSAVEVPASMQTAWENVNTPEEFNMLSHVENGRR